MFLYRLNKRATSATHLLPHTNAVSNALADVNLASSYKDSIIAIGYARYEELIVSFVPLMFRIACEAAAARLARPSIQKEQPRRSGLVGLATPSSSDGGK